jgi:predicted NUDIX family phosphoesterase
VSEKVLVFPEVAFAAAGPFSGVRTGDDLPQFLNKILHPANLLYIDRDKAEEDPRFKQIIPYCILKDRDNIFRYQRTKKGGESRLHDQWSIGIGGHINPVDELGVIQDTYYTALQRELREEVDLRGSYNNRLVGCVYDPSTEVGRVHFGVVHVLELEPGYTLRSNDSALRAGEFWPIAYLKNHLEDFESWSQMVLTHLL